ncbi:flagellar hook basal-body protein [Sphingobium subterraneum]|uniref:Flagellar basal-body rod protein FlgF n=1 Tax=Sphingobium subterraneum TaxID=627688 RepID=A0A841IV19_9SPHN|nr:flagellar hook basal-body protein [Sphingobium subterraneum]MBB6122769.1 flagellar basal-body rod protein FlgF [Sphingobium subterraneum]
MDISSYILLSHEQALRRRLDIAANNMANASTVGFHRERPVFHEYVERAKDAMVPDAKAASFVLDYRAAQDTRPGAFEATGNPLDVMIDGPGYFAVEAPGGGTAYTRAGFIKVNDSGDLVTSGGQKILDDGGRPLSVPPDALASLSIGADGTVLSKDGPLGRIGVTVFGDDGALTPRGDGMMNGAGGRVLGASETRLRSGGVEGSNVQPIVETTELVDILRSYQSSMKIADAINDMRSRAIQRLGRIG